MSRYSLGESIPDESPALQALGSAHALVGNASAARRLFLACARLSPRDTAARGGPFIGCYMAASAVSQERLLYLYATNEPSILLTKPLMFQLNLYAAS